MFSSPLKFVASGLIFAVLAIGAGELLIILKTWIDNELTKGNPSMLTAIIFLFLYVLLVATIYKFTLARAVNRNPTVRHPKSED